MDQQELERRLAEIFGTDLSRVSHGMDTKEVDNPAFVSPGTPGFNPTIPPKISITTETWTDANGNKLVAERWPDGTIKEGGRVTAPPKPAPSSGGKPVTPPGGSSEIQGTPTGRKNPDGSDEFDNNRPRQVIKDKNGTVVSAEELTGPDLTAWRAANQPPTPPARTPEQQAAEAATAQTATALNAERQWNSEHGYGWVTHADRDTAIRLQEAQARADKNVERQTAATEAANQLARDRLQFEKDKANLPQIEVKHQTINGQQYTSVTAVTPQGVSSIKNYGPDNKEVAVLPTEGREPLPAGMPALDTSTPDAAHQSYLSQVAWAQQQRQQGKMSAKEAEDLLTPSFQAAKSVIDRAQQGIANAATSRAQDINLEGTRLQTATSQFNNTKAPLDDVIKYGPKGGPEAGNVYLGNMLLQGLMNQNTRGNVGPAYGATPSPLPSPAAQSEIGQAGDPGMTAPSGNAMLDGLATRAVEQARAAAAVGPERAQQIAANPLFRPQAPVGSPMFQNSAGSFGLPTPPAVTPPAPPAVQGPPAPPIGAVRIPDETQIDNPLGTPYYPAPAAAPMPPAPATVSPAQPYNADPSQGPVGMIDPSGLPPMLQHIYGRSVLQQILGQGYGA